jgi:hypothetical protein
MFLELNSSDMAKRIADHLYDVEVRNEYIVFFKFDVQAFQVAISLENVNTKDYRWVNGLEILFPKENLESFSVNIDGNFIRFILHVKSVNHIKESKYIWMTDYAIKPNTEFFHFWQYLRAKYNTGNIIITAASEITVRMQNNYSPYPCYEIRECLLILQNRDLTREEIKFVPYFTDQPSNQYSIFI